MLVSQPSLETRRYKAYGPRDLPRLVERCKLSAERVAAMQAVARVLPFRTSEYVIDALIDWERAPDDPIFQLTFPQPGMLEPADLEKVSSLLAAGAGDAEIQRATRSIQRRLNPHPAGQLELNVPELRGQPFRGLQHKYPETVLFFPSQGQTCHAFCTYCFRWPQFVPGSELKFASQEAELLAEYLRQHPEVNSVLFTGGDPLVMKSDVLARYVEPLLAPELEHVNSIRIGTKSISYWPYRFLTDPDADELLRVFERVQRAGRHLALMAHVSHPRELETPAGQAAIRRISSTGAVIRCQAPIARHINDCPAVWADLWRLEVRLGMVPYYMFIQRDTGPKRYFEVPLARAYEIFIDAQRHVSGLARTAKGPSMSTTPGKIVVDGIADVGGQRAFVLKFLQARDPEWVGRVFFARYDEQASWFGDLEPLPGENQFFFARALSELGRLRKAAGWGKRRLRRRQPVVFAPGAWDLGERAAGARKG